MKASEVGARNVALLHDDTTMYRGNAGVEAFIAVWESIEAVEAALARLGHQTWRICAEMGVGPLATELTSRRPDAVFHFAETVFGDPGGEARLTALLDLLAIPHTSESPEALLRARDKIRVKGLYREAGLLSPQYAVARDGGLPAQLPPGPWIAKPSLEDGSAGIAGDPVAEDRSALAARVRTLDEAFDQPILIESFIEGREFHVGLLGREIMPLLEIDFGSLPPGFRHVAGYESKWSYDSVEFKHLAYRCPAVVPDAMAERLREVAATVARVIGLERACRIDLRTDGEGEIYVLDVNPNPDLSPVATMPTMANVAGWGFDGMVGRLLGLALT